ncbi:MAG: ADP-forming succinate--CoA ligase subunit beta [Dehalococcoidia bacterium]|jgi:succinyl-CoA synthetase beta subunit|nr:ADP-forming succinate--CoA ligase subunit beta [Dehalococcoidia bacterium]
MKVHEYQAKVILKEFGVPVPEGSVAASANEARVAATGLGGRAVVKAQVHAGGRGKAGGVKVVSSADEAASFADGLLGTNLVTKQTGPEGVPVGVVLVEEVVDIAKELYLSVTVDGGAKSPVVIASEAGGVEIEEVAASTPEKIVQVHVDPIIGYQPFVGRRVASAIGMDATQARSFTALLGNIVRAMAERDLALVEINPLVITADERLLAADAKIDTDENAHFRHKDNAGLRDPDQEDPLERTANEKGIQYVKLAGDVGCMVNGAGLAMATMDVIQQVGSAPANFLDVGGGGSEEQVAEAFKLIVSDPDVKKVLINVFGGILRCDVVAGGVVSAYKEIDVKVPIVVRMTGTNAEEGGQILRESGIPVTVAADLNEAAAKIAAA